MKRLVFKIFRKILRRKQPYTNDYVNLMGQQANDFLAEKIRNNDTGFMVSKFGTIELDNLVCHQVKEKGRCLQDYIHALRGDYSIFTDEAFAKLCNNAGFFPQDEQLLDKYTDLVKEDMQYIDVLGSYIRAEKYIENRLAPTCVKVDLDGYYAPFLWKNPWTKELKGKKVLVVHPFVESIAAQYNRREKLFEDPNVLPEFEALFLVKAVQSMAGNGENTGFHNWFEALEYMKNEMDQYDYDVALIGCGAYGMHLAAHAKRTGKIAIHLAGWTQMLFGIYGKRWIEDQPEYARFVNEYWIRPSEKERPAGAEKVENACYW